MGRPAFTEPELRRAMKVATEFNCGVVIDRGTIRIVAGAPAPALPSDESDEGKNTCDGLFGS